VDKGSTCKQCGQVFTYKDSVLGAAKADDPFAAYMLFCDLSVQGKVNVTAGKVINVTFDVPFDRIYQVILEPEKAVRCIADNIRDTSFDIISSVLPEEMVTSSDVKWYVVGTSREVFYLWKRLLSAAKHYELEEEYSIEVILAEMGFEVFLNEYLRTRATHLATNDVNAMLRERITNKVDKWFKEITGQSISELWPEMHQEWDQKARILRNNIAHNEYIAKRQEGKDAFAAIIDLIVAIDVSTFYVP